MKNVKYEISTGVDFSGHINKNPWRYISDNLWYNLYLELTDQLLEYVRAEVSMFTE